MTRYHYVLTIEVPGLGITTTKDVIELRPGTTRSQVYDRAVEQAFARLTAGFDRHPHQRPITRFWSLEPETLA